MTDRRKLTLSALLAAGLGGACVAPPADARPAIAATAGYRWHRVAGGGGMSLDYRIDGRTLHCRLRAPTHGWLALGFNRPGAGIVGANLLMFRVSAGGLAYGEDQHVVGLGDHRRDRDIGGRDHIDKLRGKRSGDITTVSFSYPLVTGDRRDLALRRGQRVELVLAYSVSDDFSHHSRSRTHHVVTLR